MLGARAAHTFRPRGRYLIREIFLENRSKRSSLARARTLPFALLRLMPQLPVPVGVCRQCKESNASHFGLAEVSGIRPRHARRLWRESALVWSLLAAQLA